MQIEPLFTLHFRGIRSRWLAAAISSDVWSVLGSVYVTMVTATSCPWCSRVACLSIRWTAHTASGVDPSPAGQRYCRRGEDLGRCPDPSTALFDWPPTDADFVRRSANAVRRRPSFHFSAVWRPGLARRQGARHWTGVTRTLSRESEDSVTSWIYEAAFGQAATVGLFTTFTSIASSLGLCALIHNR